MRGPLMAYQDCIAAVNAAAGRELSTEEQDALFTALRQREAYLRAQRTVAETDVAAQAAEDIAAQIRTAAIIEKRNAAINLTRRVELRGWIQQHFGNKLAEGVEAVLVGVNRAKEGARLSVDAAQESLKRFYLAGLTSDLERAGVAKVFAKGELDRDVARALWHLDREGGEAALRSIQPEAVAVARVIKKWQETSRVQANAAGAWIGKLEGYITRQSHDSTKIAKAGWEEWKAAAVKFFDLERMSVDEKGLEAIYKNLASGNHMKATPDGEPTGFTGPGNIAKRMSQERVIHFKDADSWFDYNTAFGTGNIRESVVRGLMHSAQSTGIMRVLGTNPKAMLDTLLKDLSVEGKSNPDVVRALTDKRARIDNMMAAVDGSMNIPGSQTWARRSANIRALQVLVKLGGMIFSQVSDIVNFGAGARYQGRGFFSGMAEAVGGLGRGLGNQERRDLAASLGVVLDNFAGELGRVGAFDEHGSLTRATRTFMRLNLAQWWTDHMRTSAAFGLSHHLAANADRAYGSLDDEFKRVLSLYDIGAKDWDAIRASTQKHVDGNAYVVPENVKGAAAEKLRTYLTDQTGYLVVEPDAKTRASTLAGTRPGTFWGESARFMLQFKSFSAAYLQKVVGRELYGRGYEGDSVIGALKHGNGELSGLANVILWTTLAGYASMTLKDLAKGRAPRDPTESPEMAAKTFAASIVQGGGLGIYGDFLFGEANRFGGGALETAAGPVIGDAAQLLDLMKEARAAATGDQSWSSVRSQALHQAVNNVPFANLFYTKMALDYMLMYGVYESMNPGYLRRMERRVEKQNGQSFILRPSEVAR